MVLLFQETKLLERRPRKKGLKYLVSNFNVTAFFKLQLLKNPWREKDKQRQTKMFD